MRIVVQVVCSDTASFIFQTDDDYTKTFDRIKQHVSHNWVSGVRALTLMLLVTNVVNTK